MKRDAPCGMCPNTAFCVCWVIRSRSLGASDAKAQYKKEWLDEKHENVVKGKTKTKSFQKVSRSAGTFMCYSCLVESFGFNFDPQGAVDKADRYI